MLLIFERDHIHVKFVETPLRNPATAAHDCGPTPHVAHASRRRRTERGPVGTFRTHGQHPDAELVNLFVSGGIPMAAARSAPHGAHDRADQPIDRAMAKPRPGW
jgi:hypothetical protein